MDSEHQPRQNHERHDWGDRRELLGTEPRPCRFYGLAVVLKPHARRWRHTRSEACRVALDRRERREREERPLERTWTCYGCGALMECHRSGQKFCWSACRQRA